MKIFNANSNHNRKLLFHLHLLCDIRIHDFLASLMLQLLLRGFTQTVIDNSTHIACTALVKFFFSHLTFPVISTDFQLIHTVRMLGEQGLELVAQHPPGGHPNILVHSRGNRADHPAVAVAMPHLFADFFGFGAVPQLIPGLDVQVAHNLLVLGAVAGHDIAIGVDEEGVKAHIAGQQALLPVDVVDQAVIKVGAEPLLGAVAAQKLIDQIFKVFSHHRTVVDDILGLYEIEAVVQGSSGKLHAHLVGDVVQRHQVRGILVLYRHAKADVLHAHLAEGFQRLIAALVTILQAANLVVGLLQTLDGDADANLWELLAQVHNAIGKKAVGRDHDTITLFIQLPYNIFQVSADKRLAAGNVGKIHPGQFLDRLNADFFLRLGGSLVPVAHRTACIAAIGHNNSTIQFFVSSCLITSHCLCPSFFSSLRCIINGKQLFIIAFNRIKRDRLAVFRVLVSQHMVRP